MDELERGVERSSGREHAKTKLEYRGITHNVEMRLRGQRYWHFGVEQKSLKVKLPKASSSTTIVCSTSSTIRARWWSASI